MTTARLTSGCNDWVAVAGTICYVQKEAWMAIADFVLSGRIAHYNYWLLFTIKVYRNRQRQNLAMKS